LIYSVVGNLGSGKTLLLTLLGIMELDEGKDVYSTFHITYETKNGNRAKYVDIGDLIQWMSHQATIGSFAPHSGILLVDEGYTGMDSRSSTSIANRLSTQFMFQTRKLGLDVYIASQLASSLDKRVRRITDAWILAEIIPRIPEGTEEGEVETGIMPATVDDFRYTYAAQDGSYGEFWLSHEDAEKIFPWYSTMEIVQPPMMSVDRKTAKEMKRKTAERAVRVRKAQRSEILAPTENVASPESARVESEEKGLHMPRPKQIKGLTKEGKRAGKLLKRERKIMDAVDSYRKEKSKHGYRAKKGKINRNHKHTKR
jgi:hypothetical protein